MWKHQTNQKTVGDDIVQLAATSDSDATYLSIAIKSTSEIELIESVALHYPMKLNKAIAIVQNANSDTFERARTRLKKELSDVYQGFKQ